MRENPALPSQPARSFGRSSATYQRNKQNSDQEILNQSSARVTTLFTCLTVNAGKNGRNRVQREPRPAQDQEHLRQTAELSPPNSSFSGDLVFPAQTLGSGIG